MTDTPNDPDADLRELVRSNPGQGTLEEYCTLREVIRKRAPCNLLIFGVGRDSRFWIEANEGGRTVFVEHEAEWIGHARDAVPGIEIHQVRYGTRRTQWRRLLRRQDLLFMEDLPNEIIATNWDVIFVDSPQGGSSKRPGRMKSIYTSAVLARRCNDVDVLVHDCHREVEGTYADRFLGPERLVRQVGSLRHFHLRPTLSSQDPSGVRACDGSSERRS